MKKNVRLGRDLGVLKLPDSSLIDIEDIDRYQPGQVCVISTGSQGEPMSALSLLARGREQVRQARRPRHGDPVEPRDPRQREQRQPRDRRPAARRRRGHPLRHRRRARHRPRPGRRAEDLPVDRPTRLVRADPRRVPPHRGQRQARSGDGRRPRPRAAVRGRRRARAHRRRSRRASAACLPATCTSTASSATSARACCATARCSPRRASSWSSSPSTRRPARCSTGPEIITRGWVYAPEAEDLLDEACDVGRRGGRDGRWPSGVRDVERSSATCAGRPASSSTSGPGAAR